MAKISRTERARSAWWRKVGQELSDTLNTYDNVGWQCFGYDPGWSFANNTAGRSYTALQINATVASAILRRDIYAEMCEAG